MSSEKVNENIAIKIKFDAANNPEEPTLVLARRNGDKLGKLEARSIEVSDRLNDAAEITFNVDKYANGEKDYLWDEIVDFKLVYCVEWNKWFEISVELDESNQSTKTVFCTSLGQAELSQIMLYDIEINTEADIARDEYDANLPTVLFREEGNNPEKYGDKYRQASLLHRIMEKAPHYTIVYADPTIKNIQRTFTFDNISIYDAMMDIAEEINCLFVFHSDSDENGNIQRNISVFDLQSYCNSCKHRGEFLDKCSECGSTDIEQGYGNDTMIFVTADELADDIQLTTDTGAVKNCFKLEAGDDLMTATIRNCNPNGTDYLWYFSQEMKDEMVPELAEAIEKYDELYAYYQNDHKVTTEDIPDTIIDKYNVLVDKYDELYSKSNIDFDTNSDDAKLRKVSVPIVGYPELMNVYYDTIDFELYLQSGLMPNATIDSGTDAIKEAGKLTSSNIGDVAVTSVSYMSTKSADNAVLAMAKVIVDPRFKVKVKDSNCVREDKDDKNSAWIWNGCFTVTNYSNEEDTRDSSPISIIIKSDEELYVKQKLEKALAKDNEPDVSITGLFDIDRGHADFEAELKKYSLNRLKSFYDACQACIDILIDQGISDRDTWADKRRCGNGKEHEGYAYSYCPECGYEEEFVFKCPNSECGWKGSSTNVYICDECGTSSVDYDEDLYMKLYVKYLVRLDLISKEKMVRESEIATIAGEYNAVGDLLLEGLQTYIEDIKTKIQNALDFEKYINSYGEENNIENLWYQFCAFRREDKYSNDNYISDGLDNVKLFENAREFISVARDEIYKSAELQHSISSTLKNLLTIQKFSTLVDQFQVGNWLRMMVDDHVYKLRLIEYSIDYGNLDTISVAFSDTTRVSNSINDVKDIIEQASSMATSYETIKRQSEAGQLSKDQIDTWVDDSLDLTNMRIVGNASNQNVTWDANGILCREWLPISETYDNRQLKIINRGLYVTDDGWETSKAGIGNFWYYDPEDNFAPKEAYGVIADTLVGNLILSEKVGIYNENNSIRLDKDGFTMTISKDVFADDIVFLIEKEQVADDGTKYKVPILSVDNDGDTVLDGSIKINKTTNPEPDTLGDIATNKYLTFDESTGLTIGSDSSAYKVVVTDQDVGIYYGSSKCFIITSSGLDVYNNNVIDSRFKAGYISLGETGDYPVTIDSSGMTIYDGSINNGNISSRFGSDFITIGNKTSYPVTIDSDGMTIGNSSKFSTEEILLGMDSSKAVVRFCDGKGIIRYTSDRGFNISSNDENCPMMSLTDSGAILYGTNAYGWSHSYVWARNDGELWLKADDKILLDTNGVIVFNSNNLKYTSEGHMYTNGNILFSKKYTEGKIDLTDSCGIHTPWADDGYHYIVSRAEGGTIAYFGSQAVENHSTTTALLGNTCKLGGAQGAEITSDERLKTDFVNLDKWEEFYDELEPCAFRMKTGHSGRYHLGFKAQQIEEALLNSGLSTKDFGGFIKSKCHIHEEDVRSKEIYAEAGISEGDDEYGLIYTEFIALNTHNIQKLKAENKELKLKISDLESKFEKIEELLSE